MYEPVLIVRLMALIKEGRNRNQIDALKAKLPSRYEIAGGTIIRKVLPMISVGAIPGNLGEPSRSLLNRTVLE